jgi:hypothetical protein
MTQGISIYELPPMAAHLFLPCQLLLPHLGKISKASVCLLGSKQTTSRVGKYLLTQAQDTVSGWV